MRWGGPRQPAVWLTSARPLQLHCAQSFAARLLGLYLYPDWGEQPWGLLFPGCRAVHTLGLAMPLDLVFLNIDRQILAAVCGVRPGHIVWRHHARAVIELPLGYCSRPDWQAQVDAAVRAWKIVV